MRDVYIIGIYGTPVRKYMDIGFKELTRRAFMGAIEDAGMENGEDIQLCYFSNTGAFTFNQYYLQGQAFTIPLKNEGLLQARVPIFNVEGGCASGSIAVHNAWKDILSGQSEVTMAIGIEKMYHPDGIGVTLDAVAKAEDNEGSAEWRDLLQKAARAADSDIRFGPDRSIAMDFYALLAKEHMKKYGTTQTHIAHAASKNHKNSLNNPRAQYHFDMTVEDVLKDRMVSWPLTRAMCAPIGDAAAAAILCSGDYLRSIPSGVRERAVKIRASAFAGGVFHRQSLDDRASAAAAARAYQMAGIKPSDIDVVELHDATSIAEILIVEDLQLCRPGQGGPFTASGATRIDGDVAVNTSGGLVSRGHPVGATGIMMLNELSLQLRGEAGANQVKDVELALQENGGGFVGMDVAVCSVMILERAV
ncbi:MAG: thiolase family protein [Deltaproteobacteria bacterium]|nr:thiolase family protein [Deltaproteobacteria bacterium]